MKTFFSIIFLIYLVISLSDSKNKKKRPRIERPKDSFCEQNIEQGTSLEPKPCMPSQGRHAGGFIYKPLNR